MSSKILKHFDTSHPKRNLLLIFIPHAMFLSLYVFFSILLALTTILSARVRTLFLDAVLGEHASVQTILIFLLLNLGIVFLIRYGLPLLQNILEKIILKRITLNLKTMVNRKKCAIPWFYFEDSTFNDKLELLDNIPDQIWTFFKGMIGIVSAVTSTVGIFFLMRQLGNFFVVVLFILFLPVIYFSIRAASAYYDTWQRTAPLRRFCNYQRDIMMDKEFVTERILFGYTPFFMKRWEKDYQQVRSLSIQEELRGSKKMQISGTLFCLYVAIMIWIMADRLENGLITAGFAASIISIFPSLLNSLIVDLSNQLNQMNRASHAIKTFFDFDALEEEADAFELPKQDMTFSEIIFKNVSFQYPKTSKWVLKNVDLKFEKGKQYAIVGENGAGKSTLIKLLLRLYQVSEGEILIDGTNINEIPHAELMGLISSLFQDHQHYYTNVSENIGIGDMNQLNNISRIQESAAKASFHERIETMPQGYNTILGTMHNGGIELSGGEWQKLAISRLIMSPCPLKILDEPTAAMDPVFEHALYQDFHKIMEGKTTISISHRLASCRDADQIYVLAHGGVLEQGTHEELMAGKQLYYQMYTTQKEMYL